MKQTALALGLTVFGALAFAATTQAQVTLTDWYQLNGNANDSGPGGNNGTPSGDASFVPGGSGSPYANALSLDNTTGSGFVNLGTFFNPAGAFSIVAWINTTQTNGAFALSNNQGGQDNGFALGINNLDPAGSGFGQTNKAIFEATEHPNLTNSAVSTTSVTDGTWHQIVGVYQPGSRQQVAVDGTIEGTGDISMYVNPNNFLVIGGSDTGTNQPNGSFTGKISDVQIYSGALSASQIQFLYNNPNSGTPPVPEPSVCALLCCGAAVGLRLLRRREQP